MRGMTEFSLTANDKTFKIKDLITCNSTYVVYALQCPCSLMNIGCTKHTVGKRVSDHSVSRRFRFQHDRDPIGFKFQGIEISKSTWRVANRVRELSKCKNKVDLFYRYSVSQGDECRTGS